MTERILEIALMAASVGLGIFCMILARRLRKLNDLETGLGGAIAVMAAEVDRLERAIRDARVEATDASEGLAEKILVARQEREIWDFRQKLGAAAKKDTGPAPIATRRRRKVRESGNA